MDTHNETERDRQEEVTRQQRIAYNQKPRSHAGSIFLGLILFFVLGIGACILLIRKSLDSTGALGRFATMVTSGHTTIASAPDVVNQIQRLNRLETVSYSVDTVVEGKHTNAVLPDLLFGDRLILVVHGQVIAGVDLAQLKPDAVTVSGKSVTVELPPSQIFTTRIDNSKTKVFARSTGVFTQADPNLESDTRKTAEDQIMQAASSDGILDNARTNARGSMESLLHGLGFEQVTIR